MSHEFRHALEDRVIDIPAQSRLALDNIDYSYAIRATIEGMATVVMLAYFQGLSIDKVPDARAFMRAGFSQRESDPSSTALARSPRYLRETLFSPYAEGSAFAQAWLTANQGLRLGALLEKMPVSSEQVLHFEKYAEGDQPTPIDVAAVGVMPGGWNRLYADTFGEFDLRCSLRSTRRRGTAPRFWPQAGTASGSRRLRIPPGRVALVGASVWDTEADAAEFGEGFSQAVSGLHPAGEFKVVGKGKWVDFVLRPFDATGQVRDNRCHRGGEDAPLGDPAQAAKGPARSRPRFCGLTA